MEQVIPQITGLLFLMGLVAAFAFASNFAFKRTSPGKRAAYASLILAGLLTLPGIIALLASDAPFWIVFVMPVGTIIIAAIFFPVAYLVTRLRPVEHDTTTFE